MFVELLEEMTKEDEEFSIALIINIDLLIKFLKNHICLTSKAGKAISTTYSKLNTLKNSKEYRAILNDKYRKIQ